MLPRAFRGDPTKIDPASALPEYQPPSMLSEHKGVAIFFGVLFLALAAYLYTAARKPLTFEPDPQPVYIQAVGVEPVAAQPAVTAPAAGSAAATPAKPTTPAAPAKPAAGTHANAK